ncbi:MAG: hypothetical protein WC384_03110 [Prolixibacteraceae bacterium]|jgi:Spy/CpxP family protein refolding chaperone
MKKIFSILLFVTSLLVVQLATAQNPNRFPLLRERIAQAKLREIRQSMNLDQATFDRFKPIYLKYDREVTSIDFRKMARLMRVDADSLSEEEADQMIVNQLETARQLIDIREKYYREFRKVLSPQQIIKLYQTEAEIRKKVMQELKKRLMSR